MRLTRHEQRLRRRARARVLQALYAWDVTAGASLSRTAQRVWDDLSVGAEEREFAEPLVRALAARREELDRQLADVTSNWRLERLGAIERSLLRLGAVELARENTPPRVAIQEAVRLAELFGSAESARFVNGVLDALARRMERI
jgi:N utilization substance protein B